MVSVTISEFGRLPCGGAVRNFVVKNDAGMTVEILDYGCIIRSIVVPNKNGDDVDVALGFDTLDGYLLPSNPHMGGLIGRYANRISGGSFCLDGVTYEVSKNVNGKFTLHGGFCGFDKKIFGTSVQVNDDNVTLVMKYFSPDLEEGFPGGMHVENRYVIQLKSNKLTYEVTAKLSDDSTSGTIVSLTNHSYFNLAGHDAGKLGVHETEVQIGGSQIVVLDGNSLPTGQLLGVVDTPFDFLVSKPIGTDIDSDNKLIKRYRGFDHCFVLDRRPYESPQQLEEVFAARCRSPTTGISLTVTTTQPALQFYTGNWIEEGKYKNGAGYGNRAGFALETGGFPDAPNHLNFPSSVLRVGQLYRHSSSFAFSTD